MDSTRLKCETGKILIISSDKYFCMGMRSILISMTPEILQKSGVIYDIENLVVSQFINLDVVMAENNIVIIIDYDVQMESNSNVVGILTHYGRAGLKLIVFEPKLKPVASHAYFSKKMPLSLLRGKMLAMLVQQKESGIRKPLIEELTPREGRVVHHMLTGKSMHTIAGMMGLSEKLVYAIRASAFKKFGVKSLQGLYQSSFRKFYISGGKR